MSARGPYDGEESPTHVVEKGGAERTPHLAAVWSGGGSLFMPLPERGALVLGRSERVDGRIDHDSVSRQHARILVDGGKVWIEDLGSANGTWLAGIRLARNAPTLVPPGAPLEIGSVALLVHAHDARAAIPASAPAQGDPATARVSALVDVVAPSKLSVLIIGDTGVGKERLAEQVHRMSRRAAGPFVRVNCAALAESLLEAELFGHERGAFTGATQSKAGLVEAAHGGTLFLDEIGDMPASTQAKILRVLESGEVTRVGSVTPRVVDVRIVAATNVDLRAHVEVGRFRRDLFFRLDGATIHVPPLRERPGDVEPLAQTFADIACRDAGRGRVVVSADAIHRLLAHDWPGNVRELRNVIARSVLFCRGDRLTAADLHFESLSRPSLTPRGGIPAVPPSMVPAPPMPLRSAGPSEEDEERRRILDALERTAHNQTRAAKLLGISRRTLLTRLDAFGVPRPRK